MKLSIVDRLAALAIELEQSGDIRGARTCKAASEYLDTLETALTAGDRIRSTARIFDKDGINYKKAFHEWLEIAENGIANARDEYDLVTDLEEALDAAGRDK